MVLYYSRSEKTKLFAEVLGEILGQDVYELKSDINNKGFFGFIIKALSLAFSGKSYPILNMPKNLPEEIFLCTPVWGGQVAGPAKYFLENADKNTTVNLLLTASIPTDKYTKQALDMLSAMPCRAGEAYIFATSSKVPQDRVTIKEQLEIIINAK
ncbi:MAG: hypothetical protein FWF81_13890 [Defluviitaleaceae bacterium]|nr:hypothetical protein [Defluviitaleaceae bacterium]